MISFDTKANAYRITINKILDGVRVWKTKWLPRGCSFETASRLAASMEAGRSPLQERPYQATVGKTPDVGEIYLIKHSTMPKLLKIGMTRSSAHARRANLSTAHPGSTLIVFEAAFRRVEAVEYHLHQHFKALREDSKRKYSRVLKREAVAAIKKCFEIDGYDLSEVINVIGRWVG